MRFWGPSDWKRERKCVAIVAAEVSDGDAEVEVEVEEKRRERVKRGVRNRAVCLVADARSILHLFLCKELLCCWNAVSW